MPRIRKPPSSVLVYLCHPNRVRFLIILYLHLAYIYKPIRRSLEQKYNRLARWLANHEEKSRHPKRPAQQQHRRRRYRTSADKQSAQLDLMEPTGWQAIFFRFLRGYQIFTTTYFVFIFIRYSIPTGKLIDLFLAPKLPGNCYIPGRAVLWGELMHQSLMAVASLSHIGYRFSQIFGHNQHRFDLLGFLLFPIEEIERQSRGFGVREPVASAHWDEVRPVKISNNSSLEQSYLRSIIRIPIRQSGRSVWVQRLNRTAEAHRRLHQELVRATIPIMGAFMVLISPVAAAILYCSLSDLNYLQRYPDCDPQLEELKRFGKLDIWSVHLSGHRLLMLPFDLADNVILWLDSVIGAVMLLPLIHVLNFDLLFYCQQMEGRFEGVKDKQIDLRETQTSLVEQAARKCPRGCRSECNHSSSNNCDPIDNKTTNKFINQIAIRHNSFSITMSDIRPLNGKNRSNSSNQNQLLELLIRPTSSYELGKLDDLVVEMQAYMGDFFEQVKEVDEYMSDVISTAVSIWLGSMASISFYGASLGTEISIYIRWYQLAGFLIFSSISYVIMSLQRTIESSYRLICSLAARDCSPHKARFMAIVAYFAGRKRVAYTLFHERPFLASTYLTIIGWTISCAIVFENLSKTIKY